MGACNNIVKFLLFLVNFLFVLAGIGIIVFGTLLYLNYQDFSKILESHISSPPIALIAFGSIIFLIAFLGCCGICMQSRCLLILYATVLLLLFVAQITIGILAFVYGSSLGDTWKDVMQTEFDAASHDQASFDFFSVLQKQLHCCGVSGPLDYGLHPSIELFQTCCSTYSPCVIPEYSQGCASVFEDFVVNNAIIVGGIAIGVGFLELLGSACGFAMSSTIKRHYGAL